MGNRLFIAVKRTATVLALLVATPAFGPALHGRLDFDPLATLAFTHGQGVDVPDLLFDHSGAGIPVAPDGLDTRDWTLQAHQGRGVIDGAFALASDGSSPSNKSLTDGNGSTALSNVGSGTPGTGNQSPGDTYEGNGLAAIGSGGFATGGLAHSPTASTPFANTAPEIVTAGPQAGMVRSVSPGPNGAPPVQVALAPQHPGLNPVGTVDMPWHPPVVGTVGLDVIIKGGDVPATTDPLLDDATTLGNDGLLGPTITNNWLPTYPNDGPTGTTAIDDVGVTVGINAVPEPGTLILLALGIAGLALSRRKQQ